MDGPPQPPAAGSIAGTRQTGVRLYNERLVLSLIRRHGALPKADHRPPHRPVAAHRLGDRAAARGGRAAGARGAAARARRPAARCRSSLNPDGAFSFGVKIGRRSCDLVLIDFVGRVRDRRHETYRFPRPGPILDFVRDGCRTLAAALPPEGRAASPASASRRRSSCGTGRRRSAPPPAPCRRGATSTCTARVARACDLPVYLCNDATAACAAELLFGAAPRHRDFLYVFIAWFIGGGVVLDGNLFPGRTGYAGSLGQVLVPADADGRPAGAPSCCTPPRSTCSPAASPRPAAIRGRSGSRPTTGPRSARISTAGSRRPPTASRMRSWRRWRSSSSQAVVIDGAFPAAVRARLVAAVRTDKLAALERKGLPPFAVVEGTIGSSARAIGGASLPFLAKFMRDRELLFREPERSAAAGPLHAARPSAF